MKRILNVIHTMNPETGGPCQGIRNIIPALSELGIVSEVVCCDDPQADYISADPFKIHALGTSKGYWKYNSQLFHWLQNNITRFDIILVRGLWLYHSYAVIEVIRQLKKQGKNKLPRVYIIPHGMLDPWFQKSKQRKWKSIRNYFYWNFIEKKNIQSADGILFTSATEMKLARETFKNYYPQSEINIGYGIQSPPVSSAQQIQAFRNKCQPIGDEPFILFLGRIDSKKGLDMLIEAYANLLHQKYRLSKLVIAGPVSHSDYANRLIALIHSSELLSAHIFFTGMLEGDAKWGAFYSCELFVLPSHQENFGISVAEALACGKPVLISDQVNICEDIECSNAGIICHDTRASVQDKLLAWIHLNPIEKENMAANAKKLFSHSFDVKMAAQRLCELL
jgi:glycosyltransferase involved in cell wall biosynthesis